MMRLFYLINLKEIKLRMDIGKVSSECLERGLDKETVEFILMIDQCSKKNSMIRPNDLLIGLG